MTRSFFVLTFALFAFVFGSVQTVQAQDLDPTDDSVIRKKDKERHNKWKEGKSQFPAKPRDMWQVGLGLGSFVVSGDVKPEFGWGASLHVRKSLGYVFSLRGQYMFGQAKGLNYQASTSGAHPNVFPFATSNTTPALYTSGQEFYANYKIDQYHSLALQGVFNINNIKFHKKNNKLSLNVIAGLGANAYRTKYDALDANGAAYNYAAVSGDVTTLSGRSDVRSAIRDIHDGEYETLAQQNSKNIYSFGEDGEKFVVNPYVSVGIGLEYLISKRFSIALEHEATISADDFIDGKNRKENGSLTSNIDIPHYTSLRLGIHLGSKSKRVQPLWFVNPLVYPTKDVADNKKKLNSDLFADDDKDGVPNQLDEEPDTPADTRVDTRGRALDSDGDGIPDSQDKEPFSPVGYPTNDQGVADVPTPVTKDDITRIGDEKYVPLDALDKLSFKEWYLPMIHFDLDKYNLRPEAYEHLRHVAHVMKLYPEIKVVAKGYTDVRAGDDYNMNLSYNRATTAIQHLVDMYGIDRSRLILQYNGEAENLIDKARVEPQHFMNRRVEFRVAQDDDQEMSQPEAGK